MKKLSLSLLFFFLLFYQTGLAQAPAIQWQKCYGSGYMEQPAHIEQTTDGGLIMIGFTRGPGGDVNGYHGTNGPGDYWVVKFDGGGNIQWSRTLGGSDDDLGTVIHQLPGGGYIVAGTSASIDGDVMTARFGAYDCWVLRLDAGGNILWQKDYGGSDVEQPNALVLTPDGGYLLAGQTESDDGEVTGNHGGLDAWVARLDGSGNLLWEECLGGSQEDAANDLAVLPDGSSIVAGYTYSSDGNVSGNHGLEDMWVVRLDPVGTIRWSKCFGGSQHDAAAAVGLTPDGGCILAGYTSSMDGDITHNLGLEDQWLVKLDQDGNLEWQQTYGGSGEDEANSLVVLPDSSFLVGGYTYSTDGEVSCVHGAKDAWITHVSPSGQLLWEKTLGGKLYDDAYSITPTSDGGVIAACYTTSSELPGYHPDLSSFPGDMYVAKLGTALPGPALQINAPPPTACPSSLITLKATGSADPGSIFQWMVDDTLMPGQGPVFTSTNLKTGDLVWCYAIDNQACDANAYLVSNTLLMQLNNTIVPTPSSIQIQYSPDTTCTGQRIDFKTSITGGGSEPVYQWLVDGVPTGGDLPTFSSDLLLPGDTVICRLSDTVTCIAVSTDTVFPVIHPTPALRSGLTVSLTRGGSVTLDLSPVGDISSYLWTPSAGLSDPLVSQPVAAPLTSTVYQLQVRTAAGCTASGKETVTVFANISIPGAFSPNGDGKNDIFYVMGGLEGSLIKDFLIFNRWGAMVFGVHDVAPDDPRYGWDGSINGAPAPLGTYVYEVRIRLQDGTVQVFKGTVVLVR